MDAAKREVIEETGYHINHAEYEKAIVISENETDTHITYLVVIDVSLEKMKQIIGEFSKAEHFMSEIVSVMAVPFINYHHKPTFDNFIENNFAPTVKEQLFELIRHKKWFSQYGLEKYS